MGLLKSVDNVPGIDYYEYRDSQYYNKYEYRLRVKIPGVRYTWWCKKPEELDIKIKGNTKKYGTIRKEDKQDVVDNCDAIKKVITLTTEKKAKGIGIRIEYETMAVFSNDLTVLKDFETKLGPNYKCDYTQVQTSEYVGIKHFVNDPPHNYRVYLKSKRVEDSFRAEMRDFISKQTQLHPSPSFTRWLSDKDRHFSWKYRWTSSSHFIDYDDESTLSYLALMHGEMLGKKYKLEKRPDNI